MVQSIYTKEKKINNQITFKIYLKKQNKLTPIMLQLNSIKNLATIDKE